MDRMQHFPSFSIVYGDIDIKLDLSRFEEQYKKAQYELDGNVMNSMIPFMPHYNGTFIQNTRAHSAAIQELEEYMPHTASREDTCIRKDNG